MVLKSSTLLAMAAAAYKARAATSKPTTPPETPSTSLLRVREEAAPVDSAAALSDADEAAEATDTG